MPSLPTIDDLTAAQATRVLAAYGSVAEYRVWLRAKVIEHVQKTELRALRATNRAAEAAAAEAVQGALPPIAP
jgi:hypothetical protein